MNQSREIIDALTPLDDDLKLGKGDRKVIAAFVDGNAESSDKLHTDGTRIDGLWMGGNDIARWDNGKIVLGKGRPHGRADQALLRAIKKAAAPNDLAEPRMWP